jgi:anti-anti-sigma factor
MQDAQTPKTITLNRRKGHANIALAGVCDIFEVTSLKDIIAKYIDDPTVTRIVIDCKELSRIDTSIAQILASAFSTSNLLPGRISVTNVPAPITKYFECAGLSFT